MRDSLFVFKEDGLFRISGEVSPFNLALFDSSCNIIAPDSVAVANNLVYGWTTQGLVIVSEAGVSIISRAIDTEILKLGSSNYPGFRSATFGIGYESDNSYIVFTIKKTTDSIATIAYRYSTLTNSWTNFDKTDTCGIINPSDEKLYLGAGDINFIEQERKSFNRLDYADREYIFNISTNDFSGDIVSLSDVSNVTIGDVLTQDQTLTVFGFNELLNKLDLDPSVGSVLINNITTGSVVTITTSTPHNLVTGNTVILNNTDCYPIIDGFYEATVLNSTQFTINISTPVTISGTVGTSKFSYNKSLSAAAGNNLKNQLLLVTNQLDTDPGVSDTDYTTIISSKSGLITAISGANNPTIITSVAHGLESGRVVSIIGSDSLPTIDGNFVVTVIDVDTFSIPMFTVDPGTTGSFSTLDSSIIDLKVCYNLIINKLNSDQGVSFSNYLPINSDTLLESVITDINKITKRITLNNFLDYVAGDLTIYKAITSTFTYSPNIMQDPLGIKHLREATMMFNNKAFTSATMSFASDLQPQFIKVDFNGDGNGIFGIGTGVFGDKYFGGNSNSAPFRTYVPRQCQRCRYIVVKFTHMIAREFYSVYGTTLTGEVGQSTRGYR